MRSAMRDWLLVVVAGGFLLVGYLAQRLDWLEPASQAVVVESSCDLRQQACDLDLHGQHLQFIVEPRNFQALTPLTLTLHAPSPSVTAASVEFEGLNMDMGYNRVLLQAGADGHFNATAMLPACTLERMQWLIHLRVDNGREITDYRFRIDTWRG